MHALTGQFTAPTIELCQEELQVLEGSQYFCSSPDHVDLKQLICPICLDWGSPHQGPVSTSSLCVGEKIW